MERAVLVSLETEVLLAILNKVGPEEKTTLFKRFVTERPSEEIFAHLQSTKHPWSDWCLTEEQALHLAQKDRALFVPMVGHLT